MTVQIIRTHARFVVLASVFAVVVSGGRLIAQDNPAPAEKQAAPAPAEQPPVPEPANAAPPAKPTAEAPAAKPTTGAPEPKPAEATTAAKPAEPAPAVKPTVEPPAAKPAEEAASAKPTEEPSPAKPTEEPTAAKPAEQAPPAKPAEEPPPAKPAEAEPVAKPTAEPPAAKPEETPPVKPTEKPTAAKPTEVPADASKTPAVKQVVEEPPTFDQLGNPQVAQQLGLSPEQIDEIADLLEKRAAALAAAANATDEERAAIIEENEKKLAAVLTEVQRGDFLGKPVEKRLRFMCRFQQWDEVLQWFAEQAGMSLVLDRPPQGTFNYTDTREYTPKEAIDMLNGVLITKGFTLIRRGRMLMVIDLSKAIPEGLVEQVPLEDVDKHGKFEFVTVQFDIGRRSSTSVETAIKPVLSPYHKIVSVAATQQMFVTDKAGSMQAVSQIIEAIPEPLIKPVPPPSKPEPPVVEVYPLTNADPDTALKVLQAMVPTGTIVLDPKLKQINAYAPPSQQSLIKQVLERMEEGTTEEVQQTLEVYPIDSFLEAEAALSIPSGSRRHPLRSAATTSATQLQETLSSIVPNAQLSINTESKTLVAWATVADHEKIKSVIEKLQAVHSPRSTAQLEIHRLFKVDPETTLSLFETILPNARLAIDKQTRNLIAVAVPSDQEVIRSTLKTLQPTEPGPDTPELRFYELTLAMPPDFPEVIQKVAPNATVALDQSGMRLMVIASPAEHAKVDKTIQNMQQTTFKEGRPKLVFYPVTPSQRRRFDSVWQSLSKELPGVSLVTDGAPGELAIWGRPHQHEVIVEIIEELKRDVPETEKFLLQAYPVKSDDPSGVVSMLETLYPETKIVHDAAGERLLVWTSQQEHESIKKSLEELKATGPETTPTVEVYPLTKADPTSTVTLLQSLAPDATISVDAKSENIVALATAEDHVTIKTTLEKLQPAEPDPNAPALQFYPFEKEPPANLVSILQTQTPKAEITVDAENKRLVVLASPSDQQTIQSTIAKYQEASPSDQQAELAVYPIKSADPTSALTMLQKLLPDVELSLDEKNENLLAVAVAADQETIKKTLETLESAAAGADAPQLQFYMLDEAAPADLTTILQSLAPKAQITLDADNKRLVVVATASDHEKIKATVEQFQQASQAEGKPELAVYPIKSADPSSVLSMLQQLYPDRQILLDSTSKRLLVWAKAEDQASITKSLEQLTGTSLEETSQLEIYHLTKADPSATLTLLQKLVPDAQLTLDSNTNNLIALAVPGDQQVIKSTIEQLQPDATDPNAPVLRFHTLSREPPDNLVSVLENLAPQAKITADAENERLMVVATAADHEIIKGVIEEFESSTPPEEKPKLAVYPVTPAQRRRFEAALETLTKDLPSVQMLPTSDPNELAIWAKPTEQLQVAELLKELEGDIPVEEKPQLMAYTLKSAEPAAVSEVLTKLFPDVEVVTDEKTHKVMVWAPPADQPRISAAVQQIDSGEPGQWEQIFKAHAVPNADLTVALQMLQQLLPDVTFTSDTTAGTILAWATKADHDKIAKMLEELQAGADAASTAVIYTLEGADALDVTPIVTFLGTAFPDARFSAGTQPGQVVAWASSQDHAQIKKLVEQMSQQPSSESAPKAAVYNLKSITAASAEPILQTAVPQANITVDADNPKRLTVWARPSEHETISGILQEIDVEGDAESSSSAVLYTLQGMDASGTSYAITFLTNAFPEARFTKGAEPGQIAAWASAEEHKQIKALVDQLSQKSASDVSVYMLKSITAAAAVEVLQSALPQAKFTADTENPRRLTAWASQTDHEKIKTIIEKIDVESTADPNAPKLQFYDLDQEPPTHLVTILQSLAPEAEVTSDAENKRLAVLASPADQEKIKAAVEQFQQASPAKGKPVLAVYKIRSADPQSVLSMLQTLYPKQQFVLDAKTNRLMAWASPDDQKSIKESLEQMTGSVDNEQSRFQTYPLRGITSATTAATLVSTLQPLVPDAKLTVSTDYKNLIVWATPTEHEVIRQAVEQLGHGASAQNTPQLEVHRLTRADPDTTLTLLQKLVPEAQLSLDPQTKNLIALAVPGDQQVIKSTLAQLQPGASGPDTPELRFHPLTREPTDDLVSVLKELVPQAQITADAENKRLTVVATPTDHETIKKVVDDFETSTPPEEHGTLVVYPATPAQQRRFEAALSKLTEDLPSVQVLPNSEPGELAIWAVPTEHLRVAELLKQLEGDVSSNDRPRLAAYTLKAAEPAAVSELITRLFPDVDVVIDEKTHKVMVWASLEDQARISEAIEQIDSGKPGQWEEEFKAYPLPDADPAVAVEMLQQLLPDVRLSSDSKAGTILAWGTKADHEKIAQMLEEVQAAPGNATTAVVYTLEGMDAVNSTYVVQFLGTAFPNARFSPGVEPEQVVAWASARDHQQIQTLIDQLTKTSPDTAPKVAVYDLKATTAENAAEVLQTAVPQAKITTDADNPQRLTVWARPSEHDAIKSILQEIDVEGDPQSASTVAIYKLEGMSSKGAIYAMRFLHDLFPKATFTVGSEEGQIVAWASAKDHPQIKAMIEQLTQASPTDVEVYALKSITAASASQVLRSAVPNAELTVDDDDPQRLTALATAEDHQKIKDVLEKIDVEGAGGSAATAMIYTLEGMDANAAYYVVRFLTKAFDNARFVSGAQPDQLVAWATPKDHVEIKSLIDQMSKAPPPELAPKVAVYGLKFISAADAMQVLQTAVPKAEFTVSNDDPKRLTVWARPADHDMIAGIIQEIDVEGDVESTSTAVVYRLDGLTPSGGIYTMRFLTSAFPDARFTVGPEPGQIVAWASAKDHEKIKAMVDQLVDDRPTDVAVYTLKAITATSASQVLRSAVPEAELTIDASDPQRLTALASAEDHATIQKILETIDVEGAADSGAKAVIYTIKGMDTRSGYYKLRFLSSAFPNASFTMGAEGDQIVAWATAKDHEKIKSLIDQFGEEAASEIVVYSLQNISAANASTVLQTAVPQAEITVDADNPQRLTAWARQEDHDTIQKILTAIDVEGAAGSAATSVIYTLEGVGLSGSSYAVNFLTNAFPKARFVAGAQPGQVVAWATPKDHAEIKNLVDQMSQGPPAEVAPKLTVYGLKFISAADASQVLQTALPQAKFTVSTDDPQRLAAWARPSEHETIAAILQELDVEGDAETTSTAVVYRMEGMTYSGTAYAVRFLTTAFPKARFTAGAEPGQVVAWASAKDHQQIKTLVDQMVKAPDSEVVVYSLKSITAASATQVLQSAVPNAKLTADTDDPQRLTAVASTEDQEAIKKIIETIDVEGAAGSGATAVIYTIKGMDTRSGYYKLRFLSGAFPNASFTMGAEGDQIVAWATTKDHEKIKALIDQFGEEAASDIVVYTLKNISAANASNVLQTAVPQAEITVDADNPQRLTAWARQEDHDTIQKILATIDIEDDADSSATVAVYQLDGMTLSGAIYAVRFLTSTFPKARFTVGAQPGQIVAWASAKDHEQIKALVDQMTENRATDVAVYSLKSITAASAVQVLQSAVPEAKLTADIDDPQRLTAVASAEDHEAIKKIIETIDVEGAADSAATAVIYTLEGMDALASRYTVTFLTTAFPKARFVSGAQPGQVVAWATPKDHTEIKSLIDQLSQGPPPELAPKVTVYGLKFVSAADASQVLQSAVPQAKFTVSTDDPQRLAAWARPSEHETIAAILKELDVEGDAESSSKAVVYMLEGMDAISSRYVVTFLTSAFPKARFSIGVEPGQIVAWASAKDQQEIKTLVDQLTQASPESALTAAVYSLKFITAATASEFLQTAVPQAKFTSDPEDTQRLTAWARPQHHDTIKNILEIIDVEGDADSSAKAVIYTLKGMDYRSGIYKLRFLASAFPKANFTMGAETDQIVAWATAKDHEEIKSLIDQFGEEAASEIVVYTLKNISAANASQVLQTAVPQAELTVDSEDPQRLTAWARASDHEAIETILKKIDVESDPNSGTSVVIYTLEGMDARNSSYTYRFLSLTFPKARFTLGTQPGQLVAWASAKDHEEIKALVEQLNQGPPPEDAPKATVYTVKNISAQTAVQVLTSAVPMAKLSVDAGDPQRLTAWARPSEHQTISTILQDIDVEGDPESAAKAVVYTMEGMTTQSVYYALRFLARAFPEAQFTQGAQEDQVVAWATAKDHEKIQSLIDQLGQEAASEIVVYTLKNISATSASNVLRTAVPQAEITVDAEDPQRLTAWARATDHDTIKTILEKIDVESDPANAANVVIYTLEGMDSRSGVYAVSFLAKTFPKARFTTGADPSQLIAWASAKDHEKIKQLVDQLNQGPPPEFVEKATVYMLENIPGNEALEVLQAALPEASFTIAADDPKRLTAWARPSDHQTIADILKEIDVEPDPESAARAAVYVLEGMSRLHAIYSVRFLQEAVPDAKLTLGADTTQLIAIASPKDHETIKELVKQLIEESPESARTAKVYNLQHATAEIAIPTLSTALPDATFNAGADPTQLIAWARPKDHEKIDTIIQQLETKGPPETEPQAVVYTVPSSTATEAMRILRETVPQAKLTIGSEPHQLIAWARPADHEIIKQLVEKMGEKGPDELAPRVAVYKVEAGDAAGAIAFLQAAVPNAEFSVGSDPRRLIAWASPADHEVIKKAVDELTTGADQISTRVYRFEYADPAAAEAVLSSLVPAAKIALDQNDGSLVVSAMPDDHAKIQATIDEMDSEDAGGQRPVVQVHPITVGDPANVYQSLAQLFARDTNVQLSLDEQNDAVIAVAPASKHKRIDEMIKAVAAVAQEDDNTTVELYSMKNVDSSAAMDVLDQLLAKQSSKAEVSYDYTSNQLVAIGRPEDHALIKKTLDQLRTEETVLEIYELREVDPMSAELAINREFADEGLNGPRVDTDPMTEQLFIRATAEQQQQIRDLLIKMGETKLKLLNGRSGRIMRTYHTQGDITEAIREIQRLWPKLRKNEIRIMSPDSPLPPEKTEAVPPAKAAAPKEKPPAKAQSASTAKPAASPPKPEKPAEPPKQAAIPEKPTQGNAEKPKASTVGEKAAPEKTSLLDDSAWGGEWYFVAQIQPGGTADADAAPPKSPPVVEQKPPAKEAPKPAEPAGKQPPKPEPEEAESKPPPLYIVPGEGSITVVSDDAEALQQFEQLLRTILPAAVQVGRNISVFQLENSNAAEVAERLQRLFGDERSSWRRGALPVAIVPDERLNTIVVQGSRIDRETIEGLVRVLDSDQGESTKPQIVPLRYADAVEVSKMIQDVYRSQLMSTSSSSSRSRTYGTSTSRRRPSVAVDEMTNSLVVMATSPLLEEIIELANTLDERAGESPARQIKIISLKKTSASRVEEALQRILNSRSRTTRSSR